jgi:thioredoxin-related protein
MKNIFFIFILISSFSFSKTLKSLLENNINKPIIVLISQNHCKFCENQKKYLKDDDDLIEFIWNNFQFIELNRNKVQIPKDLSTPASPTTFIIDKEGYILYKHVGYISKDDLKAVLNKILTDIGDYNQIDQDLQ